MDEFQSRASGLPQGSDPSNFSGARLGSELGEFRNNKGLSIGVRNLKLLLVR